MGIESAFLIIIGGLVVGFLVGMTGVGAGSLMTPFLISYVGVQPALAVGTDLLFAAITKASAAAPHHSLGNVNWRIVRWLALGSVPGSLATLWLIHHLNPDVEAMSAFIKQSLVIALIASSAAIVAFPFLARRGGRTAASAGEDIPLRPVLTAALGVFLGSMVTLTSVGAGAIGVVVLTLLYPMLRTRRLIGTDIVHAIPLTLVSGLGHLSIGNTDFTLLLLLLVGSIPGIYVGSRLTDRLPENVLRTALATILIFAAVTLWMKG